MSKQVVMTRQFWTDK